MRWVNFLEVAREARRGARAEDDGKRKGELEREKGKVKEEAAKERERERSGYTFSETVLVGG